MTIFQRVTRPLNQLIMAGMICCYGSAQAGQSELHNQNNPEQSRYALGGYQLEFAWNGSTFKIDSDPDGVDGKFGGAHFVINGLVYAGGTLTPQNCEASPGCGWMMEDGQLVAEFPEQVVGRITSSGWFLPQPHIEAMLSAMSRGDGAGFIEAYMAELGKVTAKVNHIIELADGFQISENMLTLDGMTGTILPGEHLSIAVTGGTGKFKWAPREAQVTMLSLFNGSGANSFGIELLPAFGRVSF
ncbi:MAG: hypothetical protein ACI9FJ_002183 [Alteromonadaceae bacterium]|jgi:hypothetical protein